MELSGISLKLYVNSFHYKVSSRTIQPARTKIITNTRINTNESGKPFVLRPFSTIPVTPEFSTSYRWWNITETRTSRTETPTTRLQHSKNTNSTSRTAVSTTTHSSPTRPGTLALLSLMPPGGRCERQMGASTRKECSTAAASLPTTFRSLLLHFNLYPYLRLCNRQESISFKKKTLKSYWTRLRAAELEHRQTISFVQIEKHKTKMNTKKTAEFVDLTSQYH